MREFSASAIDLATGYGNAKSFMVGCEGRRLDLPRRGLFVFDERGPFVEIEQRINNELVQRENAIEFALKEPSVHDLPAKTFHDLMESDDGVVEIEYDD